MRVLHATILKKPIVGIVNQLFLEKTAAENLGLSWDSILCVGEMGNNFDYKKQDIIKVLHNNNWFALRLAFYKFLISKNDEFDVLLLRHNTSNPLEYLFLKSIDKPVFLVHHTLEEAELLSDNTIKGKMKYSAERVFGGMSIKNSDGIICVTEEIFKYENARVDNFFEKKIIYPNGVFYNNTELVDNRTLGIPEILFVASDFIPWHGLDLLLRDLENTSEKFILHIVGNVSRKDAIEAEKDNRVILYGVLNQEEINEVIQKSWVGLSSFALDRKKMKEACTLKVREYLHGGVPVYSGYKDVFPSEFKYYRKGSPNFNEIIKFAKEMRLVSKQDIKESSRPYIDKEVLLSNLYKELKEY